MIPELNEVRDPAKAQEAINRLMSLADEWALKLHNAEQELKAIEADAGNVVLSSILQGGDGSEAAVIQLANARAAYDIAVKTLESIERHQVIARANLKLAQAHQLRQDAAARQSEFDAHNQKVAALLARLEELDDAPYVPLRPPTLQPGQMTEPRIYKLHKSIAMQRAINNLVSEADQLEKAAHEMLAKVNASAPVATMQPA